jgi:hypothetical protein
MRELTEEGQQRVERAAALRREGLTYEQIAWELSDARQCTTPWWIFAVLNPSKSPQQVASWMARHHPNTDWCAAWEAEYDPDAPRRMAEADRRELEYIQSHPWRPDEEQ